MMIPFATEDTSNGYIDTIIRNIPPSFKVIGEVPDLNRVLIEPKSKSSIKTIQIQWNLRSEDDPRRDFISFYSSPHDGRRKKEERYIEIFPDLHTPQKIEDRINGVITDLENHAKYFWTKRR